MIKLKSILKEEHTEALMALPYFNEFSMKFNCNPAFKYIGLKNKEHVFTAPLTDLGQLRHIISDAYYMARVTDKYAYIGIVYTLNGLEQFDATVCLMKKNNGTIETKLFDDTDSDFTDAKTNFIKLIKVMV
jgi:hypothetical protein